MRRPFLWFLNTAAGRADVPTDAELLRWFATSREESAFELLVRRHAPAVWAACRNTLRNDADAEDAFQAAFLTLARHAGSVRSGASLGGWLHRVAVNAALKLKARQMKAEPLTADVRDPREPAPDADERAAVVHQELAALSDAYRTAVVLVDLEGHSHADAARMLGWPVGTLSGRLSRAREELKRRLIRRGLAPAVPVLAGGVVSGSMVRAAVSVAVGATVAPPELTSLANEVWAMIGAARRKMAAMTAAAVVGLAGLTTAGVVALAQGPSADPAKGESKPAKGWNDKGEYPSLFPDLAAKKNIDIEGVTKALPEVVVMEDDPPAVKAAKKMLTARLEQVRITTERIKVGQFFGVSAYLVLTQAIQQVPVTAALIWDKPEQLLPWHEWGVVTLKSAEEFIAPRVKQGLETDPSHLPILVAERYKAEIALQKLKERMKK